MRRAPSSGRWELNVARWKARSLRTGGPQYSPPREGPPSLPSRPHPRFNSQRPSKTATRFSVGPLGIEPSLPAPKAGVLPVYDGPSCIELICSNQFTLSYFQCRINAKSKQQSAASVAQWIEQGSSKALMRVRFLPEALVIKPN